MKKDQKDRSTVVQGFGLMNSTSFGEKNEFKKVPEGSRT
jgi:hypothetical protein